MSDAINYVYDAFNLCVMGHGMPPLVDDLINTLDMAGLFGSYEDGLGPIAGGELAHMNLAHNYGTADICVNHDRVMYVVGL